MEQVREQVTGTMATLRDLARGVFPPQLAEAGVGAAVRTHLAKTGSAARLADRVPPGVRGSREVEAALWFCVLEALQNAAKHAGADVVVELSVDDDRLRAEVRDGGPGFDPAAAPRGSGLTNMADRMDAVDGTLEIHSAPGRGTRVVARAPGATRSRRTSSFAGVTRPVLMTVDDDPGVSRSVARDLRRRYGEDYRIVRAESGRDALDALRELKLRGEPVAAILADYRMPEMNGIEFLEAAMDIFPHARRALLTAYADTDAAIHAINVVDVDHYLLKPWDPPEEKLYPVVDALVETWRAVGQRPVDEIRVVGHRWSAECFCTRDFLARNSVPYRWYSIDDPEGERLLEAAGRQRRRRPADRHARRHRAAQPDRGRDRRGGRAHHRPGERLLRPHRHRRRPGGPRRRGVRRVGGPAHRARRAAGHRRAGRAELAHRELPRLPRRRVRRPAHRPRAAAGGEVRRRGAHRARRRRAGGPRLGPGRPVRRRQQDRRARGRARHRGVLPDARRAGRRRADRPRRVLRLGVHRGARLRGPGRLHRRRRQLGRPGRGVLLPARAHGHAAGARRRAWRRRCRTT